MPILSWKSFVQRTQGRASGASGSEAVGEWGSVTAFFDWLDAMLATNAGTFGAVLLIFLMLVIIGAIAEME